MNNAAGAASQTAAPHDAAEGHVKKMQVVSINLEGTVF
jgi:hypothetical protein